MKPSGIKVFQVLRHLCLFTAAFTNFLQVRLDVLLYLNIFSNTSSTVKTMLRNVLGMTSVGTAKLFIQLCF